MKKRHTIIGLLLIVLVLILFVPIPNGSYDDGGTREYTALTYKIVKWNRLTPTHNEDGSIADIDIYSKTSVYWFSDKARSLNELWELEQQANDAANDSRSAGTPLNEGQSGETPKDNDAVEIPTDDAVDVAIPKLTMRTLKSLVERYGEDLTWSTFDAYYSEEIGSGLYILRYPINDNYSLWIGGIRLEEDPMYIRLVSEDDIDNYIDVRTDSIDTFISSTK